MRDAGYDVEETLNTDYFLRLVNCSTQIALKSQQAYVDQGLARRRGAYQAGNWVEYARVVEEMAVQQQAQHEEVLRQVCSTLNITEEEFTKSHDAIAQSDRADELSFALKGQLLDVMGGQEEDVTVQVDENITEEIALQIFEVITRHTMQQQTEDEGRPEEPDLQ